MKSKRISIVNVRPDLRWIEEILGESLGQHEPDVPPELGQVNPALDASVIPIGEYCYYSPNLIAGFVPCPYFTYTLYGTAKCDFLGIEAYDPEDLSVQRKVAAHFGGTEQAVAAGIIGHSYFSDQFKVCGINQESVTYVPGDLDKAIAQYADAVAGHRFADRYAHGGNYPHFSDEHRRMLTAAYDRFNVWEALCERLEDVPRSSVDLILKTDALFRSLTAASDELMDGCAPILCPRARSVKSSSGTSTGRMSVLSSRAGSIQADRFRSLQALAGPGRHPRSAHLHLAMQAELA